MACPASRRSGVLRADLERLSHVKTNWLRDVDRLRNPSGAGAVRVRASLRAVERDPGGCPRITARRRTPARQDGAVCPVHQRQPSDQCPTCGARSPTARVRDASAASAAQPPTSLATSPPLAVPTRRPPRRRSIGCSPRCAASGPSPEGQRRSCGPRRAYHLLRRAQRRLGLSASAFELPHLAPGTTAPDALASAEIKLGLAAQVCPLRARENSSEVLLIDSG